MLEDLEELEVGTVTPPGMIGAALSDGRKKPWDYSSQDCSFDSRWLRYSKRI